MTASAYLSDLVAPDLRVEYRLVEELIPYARNARTHGEAQIAQIAGSIREFGFNNPVLVDGERGIIAGHGRVLAARRLRMTSVPVIELTHLSPVQKKAFVLADNRLALEAGGDREVLALEVADLAEMGFDVTLAGFAEKELKDLCQSESSPERVDVLDHEDELPDPSPATVSRSGDLWLLGQHRLLCGDSTLAEAVTKVMSGQRAALLFTSPPYGNKRDYTTGGIADWDGLMRGVFANAPMGQGGQVLVNLGLIHKKNEWHPYWEGWLDWMRGQGWRRFAWYVWDQGFGLPGDWNGRFGPSHEFVFHFNRQSRRPHKIMPCIHAGEDRDFKSGLRGKDGVVQKWNGKTFQTQESKIPDSVARIFRHQARGIETGHPAVFPVALPEHFMLAFTDPEEICFEPFSGSGTSLVAAQKTGRICQAIELAPEYCDIAIRRFAGLFPQESITLEDGRTFDEVSAERAGDASDSGSQNNA